MAVVEYLGKGKRHFQSYLLQWSWPYLIAIFNSLVCGVYAVCIFCLYNNHSHYDCSFCIFYNMGM